MHLGHGHSQFLHAVGEREAFGDGLKAAAICTTGYHSMNHGSGDMLTMSKRPFTRAPVMHEDAVCNAMTACSQYLLCCPRLSRHRRCQAETHRSRHWQHTDGRCSAASTV